MRALFTLILIFALSMTCSAQCTTDSVDYTSGGPIYPVLFPDEIPCLESTCHFPLCARVALPDTSGFIQVIGAYGQTVDIQLWEDCTHIIMDTCFTFVFDSATGLPVANFFIYGIFEQPNFIRVCSDAMVMVYFKPQLHHATFDASICIDTLCTATGINDPVLIQYEPVYLNLRTLQVDQEPSPGTVYWDGRRKVLIR